MEDSEGEFVGQKGKSSKEEGRQEHEINRIGINRRIGNQIEGGIDKGKDL